MVSLISFFILFIFFTVFSYEDSGVFKGFPVPKHAEVTVQEQKLEAFDWPPASEENGLPLRYRAIILLWGWEVKQQEGSLTVYKKGEQEVGVITQKNYLSLSDSGD
jgi:hypothetical protein